VPASRAHLSIYDYGIVLGATITDFVRTFRGRPYRVEEHVRRFYDSCKYASLTPPIDALATIGVTEELVRRNLDATDGAAELGIIYFITPGENRVYAGSAGAGRPQKATYCIHTFPLRFSMFGPLFTTGLHLLIPSTRHIPPECVDPKAKNRSRLHWWRAEQEAHLVDPNAVPLLLDLQGNLTETSGANFLLVRDGAVYSPMPRNILLGVSRHVVKELCGKLGIEFMERDLQVHDALTADEAFVTTTPYCMAPVTRINGVQIGDGRPGAIFNRILEAWSLEVGIDIRKQILEDIREVAAAADGGEVVAGPALKAPGVRGV